MARNIYVMGDVHGDFNIIDTRFEEFKSVKAKEKTDVLFVAGDAGFINSFEGPDSKQRRISHLNCLPFIIIAVLGNHENYDIIEKLPEAVIFGGKCYKEDGVDVYYAKNGQVFNIDGKFFFTFNGGLSIDKETRLKYGAEHNMKLWWEQEIKPRDFNEAFKNYLSYPIDYVITHDVPDEIYEKLVMFIPGRFKDQKCELQPFFEKIYALKNFKHWYAGHYHPSFPVTIDKCTVLPIGYLQKIDL